MTDNQQAQQYTPNNAAVELGLKLKQAREQKAYSVSDITGHLKLSTRQIECLESGNYQNMPEWVFVSGFLRTYAHFLGLDSKQVTELLGHIAQQNSNNSVARHKQSSGHTLHHNQIDTQKPFLSWLLGFFLVVLIGGGIYFWQNKSNQEYNKQSNSVTNPHLQAPAATNLHADNIAVVKMEPNRTTATVSHSDSETTPPPVTGINTDTVAAADEMPIAADELVVTVKYRSNLVIKDKNEAFVINRIVPAGSEHRFRGGAPYNVWIGYSIGATANYGGNEVAVEQHITGKTASSFIVGR